MVLATRSSNPLAPLVSVLRRELIELKNDAAQSHLKMKLARDELAVDGSSENEIENAKNEDGVQKAEASEKTCVAIERR